MDSRCLAITGGIASGKSAAAKFFSALGAPVIEADQLAREHVKPESAGLNKIINSFGSGLLLSDGNLDRAKLRKIIFSDLAAKAKLEAILHPLIITDMQQLVKANDKDYIIVDIPLLTETKQKDNYRWIDRILVIDAPTDICLKRLMQRDHIDSQLAEVIIASQASRIDRLAIAHDVLVNDGSLAELQCHVKKLHHLYCASIKKNGRLFNPEC